jgi:hypothetical protein
MPKNDNPQVRRFLAGMEKHGEREAGIRFSEANPLSKSANADKKHQWAKELCAFLGDHYDDKTARAIRADCACGPKYGYGGSKLKAVHEKNRDPDAFVEKANALDLGFSLEYDGTDYCLIYPKCYCSCVDGTDEPLPRTWCYCTLGYSRRMFGYIFGKEVRTELISSIRQGDAVCRIRINVPDA